VTNGAERTRWKIRGDRLVDENPHIRLSVPSLEPAAPNGLAKTPNRPEAAHRGSREFEHIGSVHDDAELELLKAAVRQRLAAGQGELDLGLDAGAAGGPLPISASRTGCLLDALEHAILEIVKRPCLRSVAALGIDQRRARFPSRLAALAQ
jgi:hypothetical protein